MVRARKMKGRLKPVTLSLSPKEHKILLKIAFEKKVSLAHLIREKVVELIEDEEDIAKCLATWNDTEGSVSLEEFKRQIEENVDKHP
jgi:hypothetical protein